MNTVNFFGHEISKLIIGDNPMTGHSYIQNIIPGQEMLEYYTAEKIKEGQKYIPYKLLEQIVIETNINKKLIEEINSELWYETLNGVGHIEFNNNTSFQGNMENGIIDSGKHNVLCKFKFADGTEYEGEVRDNKLTGNGKFIFPTKAIYTGQVLNGLRHGYGVFRR